MFLNFLLKEEKVEVLNVLHKYKLLSVKHRGGEIGKDDEFILYVTYYFNLLHSIIPIMFYLGVGYVISLIVFAPIIDNGFFTQSPIFYNLNLNTSEKYFRLVSTYMYLTLVFYYLIKFSTYSFLIRFFLSKIKLVFNTIYKFLFNNEILTLVQDNEYRISVRKSEEEERRREFRAQQYRDRIYYNSLAEEIFIPLPSPSNINKTVMKSINKYVKKSRKPKLA